MSKIFVCSDLHFNHDRAFVYEPRGFQSVEEMNEAIIERHNSKVSPEDEVYICGDLCLGGGGLEVMEENIALIERLNGRIHVILGNHDTPARIKMYALCKNIEEVVYATMIHYKGYHFYLSHFPTLTANLDDDKPLKARVINICGHNHAKDKFIDMDKGLIYHAELDAHSCYPVLLDAIIEDIKYFGHN